MLKRLLTASAALVVVAACSDSPVQAPLDLADPVAAFAKADRISICHLDADLGTYSSIMVNGNAETAHRGHGDGQVGEDVPGMEGFEFGEDCVPQEIVKLVFAIAYTDVDPDDGPGFKDGTDVLIAKLVDANLSGVPDAGDEIIMNQYPRDFDFATAGFASFGVTSHTVTSAGFLAGFGDLIIEAFTVDGAFYWASLPQAESYAETNLAGPPTQIVDFLPFGSGGSDALFVRAGSASQPVEARELLAEPALTDNAFIDVEIYSPS